MQIELFTEENSILRGKPDPVDMLVSWGIANGLFVSED